MAQRFSDANVEKGSLSIFSLKLFFSLTISIQFDLDEIRSDFSSMRSLGMSLVRIFLLWEDFQPTPTQICNLDKLVLVSKEASLAGLILDVTFFTGHMSGPNWIPSWMLIRDAPKPQGVMQVISNGEIVNCGYRNPYTDGNSSPLFCFF